MDNVFRFDEYLFNAEDGELIQSDKSGNQTKVRLQPQPSKLLKLLLEKHPIVVTHDEIKEAIWPDVQVDFDGSMHYCIRQIRTALNDNASNPKFIETIPRRGYRWKMHLINNNELKTESITASNDSRILRKNKSHVLINPKTLGFLLGSVLLLFVIFKFGYKTIQLDSTPIEKTRIAIMPLQPTEKDHSYFENGIAYELVEKLTSEQTMEIIGPTTTTAYPLNNIRNAAVADSIEYVLNARFYETNAKSRLLLEIIRVSDGAHIWVKSYDAIADHNELVIEVKTQLLFQVGSSSANR